MPQLVQIITGDQGSQENSGSRTASDLFANKSGKTAENRPSSIYIHVPFCFHKCHYCDFFSLVDRKDRQEAFASRLIEEIEAAAAWVSPPIQTVFVGGGTPTLLAPELWRLVLDALNQHLLGVTPELTREFTIEANPETVTEELASILHAGGVNRASVGCQSFNPVHLKTLERWHEPENVARSVERLRAAGIENINLDLIFGIPGQTLPDWQDDLDRALALNPRHLSCYGLTYEPTTPLTARMNAGDIEPIDEHVEAAMYEATVERLAAAGFEHYEISAWARPEVGGRDSDGRCRHNLVYWQNESWWPIGPGAAGHLDGTRWKNVASLERYLSHAGPLPPVTGVEELGDRGRSGEAIMLGLRLIEGIPRKRMDQLIAMGDAAEGRTAALQRHRDAGLLEYADEHLRLSRAGLLLADTVIADLM